ncbi:MAG: M20 family metallo-hydrolase [Thermoleophilia bacterium]
MSDLTVDIDAVARFGGEGTGVTRFAWSAELDAAYEYVAARLRELGLGVEIDPCGNLIGRWQAGSGKPIAVGSHLDTVPHGGRFDGSLGVLAGLHAIRLLIERGVEPKRPIWLISFNDEDGGRFGTGLFGSRAFVGRDLTPFADHPDREGITIREAMEAKGYSFDRLPDATRVADLGAYLELHIEQGPVLEATGMEIGVVSAIVGVLGFRATFTGQANHAGTTPMSMRRDAYVGAARVAERLRDYARSRDHTTTNVGIVTVKPGGFNIVPGECEFTIDARAATSDGFKALEPMVRGLLEEIAGEERLEFSIEELFRLDPCEMDTDLQATIAHAAELEGASSMSMPSGAGHDAMVIGHHVPAAMLFVPSVGGVSHNPAELTHAEDCERGARVLARALELLVS